MEKGNVFLLGIIIISVMCYGTGYQQGLKDCKSCIAIEKEKEALVGELRKSDRATQDIKLLKERLKDIEADVGRLAQSTLEVFNAMEGLQADYYGIDGLMELNKRRDESE